MPVTNRPFHLIANLLVVALALALRLGFIWETSTLPEFRTPTPGLDVDLHWQAARELRAFDPAKPQFALMMVSAPGNVFFVAAAQALLGESMLRHRCLRALLGTATVVLVYWIAFALTASRWAALASGLAAASLPSLVFFDSMILKPSLEIPLLVLLLAIMLRLRQPSIRHPYGLGLAAGVLLGLLFSSQQNTFLYIAVIAGFVAANRHLPAVQRLDILLSMSLPVVATLVVLAQLGPLLHSRYPVTLPVVGVHVNIGFHPGASGNYSELEGVPSFPYGHAFVSRIRAEAALGHALSPAEADAYYLRRARDFVRGQPADAAALVARKCGLFFNSHEAKGDQYFDLLLTQSAILRALPLRFGVLVVLSVWGVQWFWNRGQRAVLALLGGLVAAVLAANLLTFVTWRYRIDAVVPLILLSGAGTVFLVDGVRALFRRNVSRGRRLWRFSATILIPGIAAGWLAFLPVDEHQEAGFLRAARVNARLSQQAESMLDGLARMAPSAGVSMAARRQRADLLVQLHRHTAAFAALEELVGNSLSDARENAQFLNYLAWLDEAERAAQFLDRIEREHPEVRERTWQAMPPQLRSWLERRARPLMASG